MLTRTFWLTMAFGLVACGGMDPSDNEEQGGVVEDDAKEDSLNKTICGGIADLTCPKGYTCKLGGNYPDATDKCVKIQTCANIKCATSTHCEMKGINGGAIPVCIQDLAKEGEDCKSFGNPTLPECETGLICQPGPIPDTAHCVRPVQTCANIKCATGTHCEMKGINGGAIPVCIQDLAKEGEDCKSFGNPTLPECETGLICQPGLIPDTAYCVVP